MNNNVTSKGKQTYPRAPRNEAATPALQPVVTQAELAEYRSLYAKTRKLGEELDYKRHNLLWKLLNKPLVEDGELLPNLILSKPPTVGVNVLRAILADVVGPGKAADVMNRVKAKHWRRIKIVENPSWEALQELMTTAQQKGGPR